MLPRVWLVVLAASFGVLVLASIAGSLLASLVGTPSPPVLSYGFAAVMIHARAGIAAALQVRSSHARRRTL